MKIKITVTDEILKASMYCGTNAKGVAANCAIALAVRDFMPNALVCWTRGYLAEAMSIFPFVKNDLTMEIPLPEKAHNYITLFDNSTPLERLALPNLSFEIEVPDSIIDQIGITEVREILSNSLTMEEVV